MSEDCPLPASTQIRNVLLFGTNVGLVYLSAPVVYVGVTQSALCDRLKFGPTAANLPGSSYLIATPLAVFVAWYFCQVRRLKPVLSSLYLAAALLGAIVALTIVQGLSPWFVYSAMVAHALVLGVALGAVNTFQWEILGRAVSNSRRGTALAVAFGAGPALAFLSSSAQAWLMRDDSPLTFPNNFALLYGASVPAMLLAAYLSTRFVIPLPAVEVVRQPLVQGLFGDFYSGFLRHRLILVAACAYLLVYSGHSIQQNLSLYSAEVIVDGDERTATSEVSATASSGARQATAARSDRYVGMQNMLRFGCKVFAGLFLGWLLTKTNPKSTLIVTASLIVAGILWALVVPGVWYLGSFAIFGAGELFGAYYNNYVLDLSAKARMRRNMAYMSLITLPVGIAPMIYGAVAEHFSSLRASFYVALVPLAAALCLVYCLLPRRPTADASKSDAPAEEPVNGLIHPGRAA